MNNNLFTREMRRNALSLIVWTIILTLLIAVTMSVYPTFLGNQSKIMGMLSLIPEGSSPIQRYFEFQRSSLCVGILCCQQYHLYVGARKRLCYSAVIQYITEGRIQQNC